MALRVYPIALPDPLRADFFTARFLTFTGLVRHVVLFVLDFESRRVHIAGVACQPHGAWIQQVARNFVDHVDGFLQGKRYLLHDRDPLFTDAFRAVLRVAGVTCFMLPARSPNLNSFSGRFVLSIKSECPSKLVPLDEHHLRDLGVRRVLPARAQPTKGSTIG